YGVMARNYVQLGLSATRGIPVLTVGKSPDAELMLYPDHSPLVALLIAVSYVLFGIGEWQTRLPTAISTVAAVYALYRLLRADASERVAAIAAALFATMPITLYFGGMPEVVGMPLVLFILLSLGAYLKLYAQPSVAHCCQLLGLFTL